ncbi:hypothetical protein M8818_007135 [Zalaria obscura]|uniref:Uncharacterized protein n=1 Tax=Zalaria obscura TaxID=2024903 RepID=A0ACC3S566_9PEZI
MLDDPLGLGNLLAGSPMSDDPLGLGSARHILDEFPTVEDAVRNMEAKFRRDRNLSPEVSVNGHARQDHSSRLRRSPAVVDARTVNGVNGSKENGPLKVSHKSAEQSSERLSPPSVQKRLKKALASPASESEASAGEKPTPSKPDSKADSVALTEIQESPQASAGAEPAVQPTKKKRGRPRKSLPPITAPISTEQDSEQAAQAQAKRMEGVVLPTIVVPTNLSRQSGVPQLPPDSDDINETTELVEGTETHSGVLDDAAISDTKIEDRSDALARGTHLADVREKLRKHIKELHDDREYIMRNWLAKARAVQSIPLIADPSNRAQENASGMIGIKHDVSPFASIAPIQIQTGGKRDPHLVQIFNNPFTPSGQQIKQSSGYLGVPLTTYSEHTEEVPGYTHYVSLKQNLLAENQKQLHTWPYFADEVPEDVYETVENVYDTDIEHRWRKLLRAEQAVQYAQYIEPLLEELQCSMSDILHYLLDPLPDLQSLSGSDITARDEYCLEDFDRQSKRWVAVRSILPAIEPQRLSAAALLCKAFQEQAGFSIWHIARRSHFCELASEDTKDEGGERAYTALACRICHTHDCPYHGELRERSACFDAEYDSDDTIDTVDALDIDHPPNINFKKRVNHLANTTQLTTMTIPEALQKPTFMMTDRHSFHVTTRIIRVKTPTAAVSGTRCIARKAADAR